MIAVASKQLVNPFAKCDTTVVACDGCDDDGVVVVELRDVDCCGALFVLGGDGFAFVCNSEWCRLRQSLHRNLDLHTALR